MSDQIGLQKIKVGELQKRLEEVWPSRVSNPEAFSSVLNELNEAIMELDRLWQEQQR